MYGWRRDVALLRESFTGEASGGWREDLTEIAASQYYDARNWREAVRLLASGYGVIVGGWRDKIAGIALALGMALPGGWRENLRYIREYYEDNPPVVRKLRLYDSDGYALFDSDGYALFVRS